MKIRKLFASLMSFVFCLSVCIGTVKIHQVHINNKKYGAVADESEMDSEYSSNLVHYNNEMVAYFDNLTCNFGQNYKESCSFVALGMLLSYYDTFLNDDIIPELYDVPGSGVGTDMTQRRNSPGIMKDTIVNPEDPSESFNYVLRLSNEQYYLKLRALADKSLHAKFLTMYVETYSGQLEEEYPFGANLGGVGIILDKYFSQTVQFARGTQYDLEYVVFDETNTFDPATVHDRNDVKNFVIKKIKAGYPVLLAVDPQNGMGHTCIAYDYNDNTGEIFCHMGWGAGSTHVTPESRGLINYDAAMVIDFNLAHKHSDNYEVVSFNNGNIDIKRYCPCSSEITVYNPHSFSYENTDENYHTYTCDCGLTKTEKHSYTLYSVLSGMIGSLKHNVECVCGTSKKQMHTLVTQKIGSESYTYCTKCFWSRIDKENGAFNYNIIDFKEFVKSLAE